MHHVALAAVVGHFYLFLLKMLRHTDHFYKFSWSGLDYFIMAAKAELGDFISAFDWQCTDFFIVLTDVMSIRPMADFAGNGFMDTIFMDSSNWFMTLKTGIVGTKSNRYILLVYDIGPAVMSVLPHRFRSKCLLCEIAAYSDHDHGDDQLDQMGVVPGSRLLMHVGPPYLSGWVEKDRNQLYIAIFTPDKKNN